MQVYVTAITAAGGDTAVLATYFHVALFGPARTWLMNRAGRNARGSLAHSVRGQLGSARIGSFEFCHELR
jgi:hypothetical protein